METTITLHGLTLTDNRAIGAGLFSARDVDGKLRIHNGQFYIGYSRDDHSNRKGQPRFGFCCWKPLQPLETGRKEARRYCAYKTLAGAERALVRVSLQLNQPAAEMSSIN